MNAKVTAKQIRIQQEVLITLLAMIEHQDERIAMKKRNLQKCSELSERFIKQLNTSIEIATAARERLIERYERQVYKLAAMLHENNSKLSIVTIQSQINQQV